MSRGRNAQSSRQIIIQQMLTAAGGQGLSPAEILERMKDRGYSVTKRTIHRDIEGLQVAGFPVTESGSKSDKGGIRWKVDISASAARSGHSSALKINPQQLAGLYLAKAQFKSMAQNPLFSGLDHFFEQVSDLIGSRNRALLDEFARTFHVAPTTSKVVESDPQVVETIQAAIQEGHCVSVRYQSANSGTDRTRKLGPHYVYIEENGVYLVAEDMETNQVKTFAVPRVKAIQMTDEEYTGQATSPENFFGQSFGVWRADKAVSARVKFGKSCSHYVKERKWHPSQKLTEHTDGTVTLDIKVGITPRFVGWILSFGQDAQVESPAELREAVTTEAENLLRHYVKRAG